jgi:glycine/D-amino acid oxidase-like deaminating enzyme
VFQRLLQDFADRFTLETATAVVSIDYEKDESFPYHVTTQRGVILANQVIHCTNGFAGHLLPKLVGAIYPSRGTMSAQKPHLSFPNLGGEASWTHFSKASFDPETGVFGTGLYYTQQNEHTGEIFIGGERQKVTDLLSSDDSIVSSEARESLSTILPRVFKGVEPIGEQRIWSGIMGFTSDGLPLVGKLPAEVTERDGDGEWIAAGFNGHGMDKCWLSGETVARMVLGKDTSGFPNAFLLSRERLARSGAEQSVDGFMSMLASA